MEPSAPPTGVSLRGLISVSLASPGLMSTRIFIVRPADGFIWREALGSDRAKVAPPSTSDVN